MPRGPWFSDLEREVVVAALDAYRAARRPATTVVDEMDTRYIIASQVADRLEDRKSRFVSFVGVAT